LRLFTFWKSSSWAVDSTVVLFTALLWPACALTFRTAFSPFSVTVYKQQRALKSGFPSRILQSLLCFPPHY
jgi:hypothetical protein